MSSLIARSASRTASSTLSRSTPGIAATGMRVFSPSIRKSGQMRSLVVSTCSLTSRRAHSALRLRRGRLAMSSRCGSEMRDCLFMCREAPSSPDYTLASALASALPSRLLAGDLFGFRQLGFAGDRLEIRLEPGLRDEGRRDGAGDHRGDEDRILLLIDDLVGEPEKGGDRAERKPGRHQKRRVHPLAPIELVIDG